MTYRVIFQPRAFAQLEDQYRFIAEKNPIAAARWFNRFKKAIEDLSHFPEQFPLARESALARREIRLKIIGKRASARRTYYVIDGDTVRILCIRHSARSDASMEDFEID
ncbi:MAG: type II toxin-antitoxin system RelE/ParE family toxin [Planctomycetota bacterium]